MCHTEGRWHGHISVGKSSWVEARWKTHPFPSKVIRANSFKARDPKIWVSPSSSLYSQTAQLFWVLLGSTFTTHPSLGNRVRWQHGDPRVMRPVSHCHTMLCPDTERTVQVNGTKLCINSTVTVKYSPTGNLWGPVLDTVGPMNCLRPYLNLRCSWLSPTEIWFAHFTKGFSRYSAQWEHHSLTGKPETLKWSEYAPAACTLYLWLQLETHRPFTAVWPLKEYHQGNPLRIPQESF